MKLGNNGTILEEICNSNDNVIVQEKIESNSRVEK